MTERRATPLRIALRTRRCVRWRVLTAIAIIAGVLALSSSQRGERVDAQQGSATPAASAVSEGPAIRVLLASGSGKHEISARVPIRVYPASGTTYELEPGLQRLDIDATRVSIGGRHLTSASLRICASGGEPVSFDGTAYDGWIEVHWISRRLGGNYFVVNRLPIERYLLGVLAGEMSASFPPAALEAQAVAARTYALYQIVTRRKGVPFDVYASTRSQAFKGAASPHRTFRGAVMRTRGQVMFSDGRIFKSYYHSQCGGATMDGFAAFGDEDVKALSAEKCGHCDDARYAHWQCELQEAQVRKAVARILKSSGRKLKLGRIQAVEPIEVGRGDHAAYVKITHALGSLEVDAIRFREQLIAIGVHELRSTAFRCEPVAGGFHFDGRGWGHGVGMCQIGAAGLAKTGSGYLQILNYYYRGCRVMLMW